jgi:hypothetical protein
MVASYDPASGIFTPVPTTITGSDPYVATATVSHFSSYGLVFPAPLIITPDDQTMTYGGSVPRFTVGSSGYKGLVNGDTSSVVSGLTCGATDSSGTPVSSSTPAGTYAITCTGGTATDYAISYQPGTLTINPAPLTVTASSPSMTYGSTVPTISPSYTGFVNGDSPSSLTTVPTCITTATPSSPVGSYPTTCSRASDPNYTNTYVSGTLSIEYAPAGKSCDGSPGHAILPPISADGSSVFKQGSTVPAKFRVCDANGRSIGTPGVVTTFVLASTSASSAAPINESVDSTTPDTAFRWDAMNQQWIFNISTKSLSAGTTYNYLITLNDGTTIPFSFALK